MTTNTVRRAIVDDVSCPSCLAAQGVKCSAKAGDWVNGAAFGSHEARVVEWMKINATRRDVRSSAQFFDDVVLALVSSGFIHSALPTLSPKLGVAMEENPYDLVADVVYDMALALSIKRALHGVEGPTEPMTNETKSN